MANSPKQVEKRYRNICKKLTEVEVNNAMFSRMIKSGVATNDVRTFVIKQSKMKRANQKINIGLAKNAMKYKLNDACSVANRLRQEKRKIRDTLVTKFKFSKSKCRRIVKSAHEEARSHRHMKKIKATSKFEHCRQKMKRAIEHENFQDIPEEVREWISGVNIFNNELTPEPSIGPMICDPSIKISKNELAFLRRGPRFMVRQELNLYDFKTEVEKMIAIEKYDKMESDIHDKTQLSDVGNSPGHDNSDVDVGKSSMHNNSDVGNSSAHSNSDVGNSSARELSMSSVKVSEAERVITAKSSLIYDKATKSLDMGRLRATEYKFNKFVCLPKAENIEREALHEVRRNKMVELFEKATAKENANKRKKGNNKKEIDKERNSSVESNLSKAEQEGLKSLQKRVNNKEIVVTETDKSRRFCVLTVEQYLASGRKHTKKDKVISYDDLHNIQKSVNDHGSWLRRIFGIGNDWNHAERINHSMTDRGEVVAPLYLLIKDHKGWTFEDGTPPPSRPVCSGNQGFNRHLSEVLSMVLEPVGHALGGPDIDSTGGLLNKINKINEENNTLNFEKKSLMSLMAWM